MSDSTLYLFDGSNLAHAGEFRDREALIDELASFLGSRGARGVVVFDGEGRERQVGPLAVRFAPDADTVLERLAVAHRRDETVVLVTSDAAVQGTSGLETRAVSSSGFLDELRSATHSEDVPSRVRDRVDTETRTALERLRRGLS